jgi:hypothetical protein
VVWSFVSLFSNSSSLSFHLNDINLNALKVLNVHSNTVYEINKENEFEKLSNVFLIEFQSNFIFLCDLKSFIKWPSFLNFFHEIDNDTEIAESFLDAIFMISDSDESIKLINLGRDREVRYISRYISYICIYIYMYTSIHIIMYLYKYTYKYKYVWIYVNTYIHIYLYIYGRDMEDRYEYGF